MTLHAAAISTKNGILVFLGPPETGKSTMCHLLKEVTYTVSDDRIHLYCSDNRVWRVKAASMESVRRFEVSHISDPGLPRLAAIIRLHQSERIHLERLSALNTCRNLTNAFFELVWQRSYEQEKKETAFALLADVSRSVSGYKMEFNLSPQTLELMVKKFDL